ncbi:MAG TPA: acyltransferase [Chthoniobacterales bacterium]|nr:acyltransferase [Chthoniobacterales bacterium]
MNTPATKERISLPRFLARLLIKFLMLDGHYLKKKLLLQYVVHGPEERLVLGENTDPNDTIFNTMSGKISLGDFSIFGHGCQVLTGTHRTDAFLAERKKHPREGRDITIGEGVWIGSGAIILGGVTIASHCVIAAGSIVRRDCLTPGIYAGNPAVLVRPLSAPI